ncbi:MAG TPA: NapC/NirT family cytochrome c [Symbiobacteriaceae bacterium]|nr:NapC/NirT family cytochrome c [Symbiobacteriaceae bacterium]
MRKPILIGILAGAALVVGLALFGPGALQVAGAEPDLCASCHVMESNVHAFENSDSLHKTAISCSDCHLPTGFDGIMEKYKTGFRHIVTNMKGAPEEIHLRATDRQWVIDNCYRCHATEEHIQEVGRNACLTCHATDPHGDRGTR